MRRNGRIRRAVDSGRCAGSGRRTGVARCWVDDALARAAESARADGRSRPEAAPKEFLVNHVHAHLDVFIDGEHITVPAGIGINIEDPDVRTFDNPVGYGGIEMCAQPCISPLHTHDETGVLHTESMDPKPHTLGQFFVEWGVELSETCVAEHCDPTPIAVYIDGEPYEGDPRAIELTDEKVIVIAIGTPPEEIPSTYDFSNA